MLTLATLAIVAATLWFGFELGFRVRRHRPLQVLRALWPALAALALWQLVRFCSNTNDQGGDITAQLLMEALAFLQVPLFGLAVGAGALSRVAVRGPLAGRKWKPYAIGLVALLVVVVTAGLALGQSDTSYPHPIPAGSRW